MRHLEYGKFDAEFANFVIGVKQGTSIIIEGAASNYTTTPFQTVVAVEANLNHGGKATFLKLGIAQIRSLIGHAPIILSCKLHLCQIESSSLITDQGAKTIGAYRVLTVPDWTDLSARYRDVSASLPWTNDAYHPMPDVDIYGPVATVAVPARTTVPTDYSDYLELASELAYCLKANRDLMLYLHPYPLTAAGSGVTEFAWDVAGKRPYLEITYMFLVEAFKADSITGEIDLAGALDAATASDDYRLYLGWIQRSEVGTPVKFFLRNFARRDFAHLEVWDDFPSWSVPVQVAGSGTGALNYPVLDKWAVSQKYTINMTSSTAFRVKAEAYRGNLTSLSPSYGGVGWDGVVGTDWTAPSGGLTILAAAWTTAGLTVGDTFEIYVLGNSSDSGWPSDSASQAQITNDSAGSPVTANYRPVEGQRTKSTGSVTIDAATKTVNVLHITTALWPVGSHVFIADGTNIDEGTIDSVTETSVTITGLSVTSNAYAAGAFVGTTLPVRTLTAAVFGQTTQACGASQAQPNRIYLTDPATAGFSAGDTIFIQDLVNPSTTHEEAVIASGGVHPTYVDLTANLAFDYAAGAFVTKKSAGDWAGWSRIVATSTTTEERKDFRLNVAL